MWTACQPSSSNVRREVSSAAEAQHGPPSYEVSCAAFEDCHESVALLVGLSAPEEPMRCTAALIGPTTAVTARHCVSWEIASGGCHDVWLGFAQTRDRAAEWVGCSGIRAVSDPQETLLAPDYAVLELRAATARAPLRLGVGPLSSGEVVHMVSVTPDRFYDEVHRVETRRCVIAGSEQSSPWSPVIPASVRVLHACPIRLGNSGAPLLDRRGRMRGLVHAAGPPYFGFGLMTESGRISDLRSSLRSN